MADHIFYVICNIEDVDGALTNALENEGLELSDDQYEAVVNQIPDKIGFKVYLDDDDVEGTIDVIDEDWG